LKAALLSEIIVPYPRLKRNITLVEFISPAARIKTKNETAPTKVGADRLSKNAHQAKAKMCVFALLGIKIVKIANK